MCRRRTDHIGGRVMSETRTTRSDRIGQGKPGPGRPKGLTNKLTRAAKEAFELAFQNIGAVKALTAGAKENPGEFFKLYARLIPTEQHIGNPDGSPVNF